MLQLTTVCVAREAHVDEQEYYRKLKMIVNCNTTIYGARSGQAAGTPNASVRGFVADKYCYELRKTL